jgi:hypothetical protein
LQQEKLYTSATVLQDEVRSRAAYLLTHTAMHLQANMRAMDIHSKQTQTTRLRKAIVDGEWEIAAKLLTRSAARKDNKKLLYYLYRQEFLELIDRQEFQRAFGFLTKRLKSLEDIANASAPTEFKDLCYLLTCKTVHDTRTFQDWGGVVQVRTPFDIEHKRISMCVRTC